MKIEREPLTTQKINSLRTMLASDGWATLLSYLESKSLEKSTEHIEIILKSEIIGNQSLKADAEKALKDARLSHELSRLLFSIADQQDSEFYSVKITP